MVDFHSHILPGIDDGAPNVFDSLEMLRESSSQGVDIICATPHFYADEEDPQSFLERRNKAWLDLRRRMAPEKSWPEIRLGAEVLFFPGISGAEEMKMLCIEGTHFLLIEPPMSPWSESMLEEIEECWNNLQVIPVIAHVDRYMSILRDPKLLERLKERRVLCQVNASFFLRKSSCDLAMESLRADLFHFIGSDCHNTTDRAPNMAAAEEVITAEKDGSELLRKFDRRVLRVLKT